MLRSLPRGRPQNRLSPSSAVIRYLHSTPCAAFAAPSSPPATALSDVTIVGGGVTGLTCAYQYAKIAPDCKIRVIESKSKLGGWISSKAYPLENGEDAIFEEGPRSIRPGRKGCVTLKLIQELGLVDDVVFVPRSASAAQKRYIYYPDRLNRLPPWNGFLDAINQLQAPLWRGCVLPLLKERLTPGMDPQPDDESVGAFISRRTSRDIAEKLASSMIHGIYAGNIWDLSAETLFPRFRELERRYGSLLKGSIQLAAEKKTLANQHEISLMRDASSFDWDSKILEGAADCSIFYLKGGTERLITRLRDKLSRNKNVELRMDARVSAIRYDKDADRIKLELDKPDTGNEVLTCSRVISTLFARHLAEICRDPSGETLLPPLMGTKAVTVMTVSLLYETKSVLPRGVNGFGYLIPEVIPLEQNPERALGVVFDSDVSPLIDTLNSYTKLTVMFGGHLWNDCGFDELSKGGAGLSSEDGEALAMQVVERHLGIRERPIRHHAAIHADCIPQYPVGNVQIMRAAKARLETAFGSRLAVAGSSYTGVGVNDCIDAATSITERATGLETWSPEEMKISEVSKQGPFWT